ncbi:hypothetical protein Syun_015006 [Stephania yunnanensis]|uniref:Uncharacterized protein n=1 Tax=Stephania yunnanensis TaxID=152371 RepID=A0AAP0JLG7_9MAGN
MMSPALVIQARCAFTIHNPPETSPVQARHIVAEEAQVQVELILPTFETLLEDTLNTLTDTGVKATTEARQTRKFQRHYPEKLHGAQYRRLKRGLWLLRALGAHAPEYQSHYRHHHVRCDGLEMIKGKRELNGHDKEIKLRAVTLVHYSRQHRQILDISTIGGPMAEAVARDKVRAPVKCTDKDRGLVRHRDKDRDNMFHTNRDFGILVWECGQPCHFTSTCSRLRAGIAESGADSC